MSFNSIDIGQSDLNSAYQIAMGLLTTHFEIVGTWMVGLKRILEIGRSL